MCTAANPSTYGALRWQSSNSAPRRKKHQQLPKCLFVTFFFPIFTPRQVFLLLFCLWRTNKFGSFSADAVPDSFLEFAFLPSDPLWLLPSYPHTLGHLLLLCTLCPPTLPPSHPPTLLPSYPPTLLPSYPPTLLPSYLPTFLPSCPPIS